MINFYVEESSVRGVQDYFKQLRARVNAAAKAGMKEAMEGLAIHAVDRMGQAGIHQRTGETAAAIMRSPRVSMSGDIVKGTVSSWVGAKPMGEWLGLGTNVPAVANKLMVFFNSSGQLVFARKHAAFRVPGRPFMNPALNDYKQQIIAAIAARMQEAMRKP